jgi:hypothetical protein
MVSIHIFERVYVSIDVYRFAADFILHAVAQPFEPGMVKFESNMPSCTVISCVATVNPSPSSRMIVFDPSWRLAKW